MTEADITAAGAVVLRRGPQPQVLLVHRPKYDDWSLPKGKTEPRESAEACAVREVAEETGVRVRLTATLGSHCYPVGDLTKRVDWWVGEVVTEAQRAPDAEIDGVRWLPVEEATARLSYADEADRLARALVQPRSTPLLITRHAKAVSRSDWAGSDADRPLTARGEHQANAMMPVLAAFGVRRVISSTAVRCLETVAPYARSAGLTVEGRPQFTEESGQSDPERVVAAMRELRDQIAVAGVPTVVCGHRPVLPTMLDSIGLPYGPFATGETLVAQVTPEGEVHNVHRASPTTADPREPRASR